MSISEAALLASQKPTQVTCSSNCESLVEPSSGRNIECAGFHEA